MHILFLTDNFPPEVNAPASRTFEHCREWVKSGHQVTIITCVPNFPKGKVFGGYKNKLWQSESIEGIRVVRVWSYITSNNGFLKRILDYQSFMVSAIIASIFIRKIDVIIGTSPQFFTVCAAYVTSVLKRKPWVFELRDIWPESIKAVGAMEQSRALALLEKLEMFLYRKATIIISVTNSFRNTLKLRGIDEKKIHVVTNGVDARQFSVRAKDQHIIEELKLQGKFIAGYIGTHGLAHSLDIIIDAAKIISTQPDKDLYHFLCLGDGAMKESLQKRVKKEGITNITFIDSVAKDQVVRYWSILDVSLVHLKKTELFKAVIPSKIFESMAMGIPILHGVQGESAEIITDKNVGLTFEPQNAQALVDGLQKMKTDKKLYKRLKANGPTAAQHYSRPTLADNMLEILVDIA